MELTEFTLGAVGQRRAEVAAKVAWIVILRVDHVTDSGGQRQYSGIVDARLAELQKTRFAIDKPDRHAERSAELRCIGRGRAMLGCERLPQAMHGALANFAEDVGN